MEPLAESTKDLAAQDCLLSNVMYPQPDLSAEDRLGDFDALLKQLEGACDPLTINGGYANLMARIASPEFRRRCGADKTSG